VTNPSPSIRNLNENLRENVYNTALILNALTLAAGTTPALQQVREQPIIQVVVAENARVSSLARTVVERVPIVMFLGREDFASQQYEGVVNYGEIDLATLAPTHV
jgi:hypothetical protein